MKVVSHVREKKKLVRVIVGNSETGCSNISKPTKMLSLEDTNVDEVFNKISKCLESEDGKT